jgi:hypothetical protein
LKRRYRFLDAAKTVATIEKLQKRIEERFPESGLSEVCKEVCKVALENKNRADWIAKPKIWIRLGVAAAILLSLFGLAYTISVADISFRTFDVSEFVQISEAALNEFVLIGAAVFFLVTIETRLKRARAMDALHELRDIAHVIDMHQLTKDPSILLGKAIVTPSSPEREMNAYRLSRYLDYCSEMLSLTGKITALYASNFRDPVVLSAVNELEVLTTSLSRKIWQKIMLLHEHEVDSTSS